VNHFAGTQYDGTVIIGGKFTAINVGGTFEFIYNIALLSLQGGVWKVAYVGGSPLGDPGADGWQGVVNNNDPDDPDVGVFSITPFPANSLTGLASGGGGAVGFLSAGFLVGGKITDVLGEGSGFLPQTGYFNLIPFFCNTASPLASAQVLDEGLAIGATPPQPKADGAVCGCLFDATYQYMWLTGNGFERVKDNGSSTTQLVPPNCQGFVLFYPVGLSPGDSAWGQLGAIAPSSFGTAFQYDIKPSTTLANHIVCMGDQMFLKDITVPTAGNASYTAIGSFPSTPVAVGFPVGVQGYFNSILRNVTITTPTGSVTGDFFVYNGGGGGDGRQYVGYMTTATGTTVNPLDPIPCGPNSVALGTIRPSYGINNLITPTVLTIGGDLGEYNYDAQTHSDIRFTTTAPVFFKIPAGTANITKADFNQPYQSQSYIASSDLASWVQIGEKNPNLTYSP
jgi:hypothetical protein